MLQLPPGPAICYSGYRQGQSPVERIYPTVDQIRQDLQLLHPHWRVLRLYDCSEHAERVLEVIRRDGLGFKVLLGAYLGAEASNPACPWGSKLDDAFLAANRRENEAELRRLVSLARQYADIVFAVSVGNEAAADWTDHLVPLPRLVEAVRWVKQRVGQPVTVCEHFVPWLHKLQRLVQEIDFVSVHTYPVWDQRHLHEALEHTRDNVECVARLYPGKAVVVTEAGWATRSNGCRVAPEHSPQSWQAVYIRDLLEWSDASGTLVFVFEAFDEPWKGPSDPLAPDKRWGLYTVEREPKEVMRTLAPVLAPCRSGP